jgi:hypothetical protein
MGIEYGIVPASLAVKAMRDSGYKNTAYAIAELVDNAIQAGSNEVEILCQENEELVNSRNRRRLNCIAIVDNGCGMNAVSLRRALQFGNGERLADRSGIGRFGMGLPNSSISQAKKVEVWSWQDGVESANYTYLDIDEIVNGVITTVPEPVKKNIPITWLKRSKTAQNSKSGTLVIWSELDKCAWKTSQSIFKNSELIIGRIYRKFIFDSRAKIRMADFLSHSNTTITDNYIKANDPLYLMSSTSTPTPWNKEPMFEKYGEEASFSFETDGVAHEVKVIVSVAKHDARSGHNAGDLPHGKHARGNIGVSVVRADRELELQTGWCNQYDPRERWWGIEINFPPALDEIFGVTNNKQSASALSEYSIFDQDQIAEREGYSSASELETAWLEDKDPRVLLLKIQKFIKSQLSTIRGLIKAQATPRNSPTRHKDPNTAESIATVATRVRQQTGYSGTSDFGENLAPDLRIEEITTTLTSTGIPEDVATETASRVVDSNQKFEFYNVDLQSSEFFTVRPKGGTLLIGLNTGHPAYDKLVALLEPNKTNEINNMNELKLRLNQSYEGLKLLLEAWARYEDELPDGVQKERAQMARAAWGSVARDFLRED